MKAAQFYKIYFSIQDYLMILFGTYYMVSDSMHLSCRMKLLPVALVVSVR